MNRRESLTPTAPGMDPKSVVLPLDEGAQVVAAQAVAREEHGRETPRSGDRSGDGFLRRAWNVVTYPASWLRWRVRVHRAYKLAVIEYGTYGEFDTHCKQYIRLSLEARPTLWGGR